MRFRPPSRAEPERHTPFFELWDALGGPECAICQLGAKAGARSLDALLYEYVNDPETQSRLVASGGFGPRPLDLLTNIHDTLGLSILYHRICDENLAALESGGGPVVAQAPCPYELARANAERRFIHEFIAHLGAADFFEKYRQSPGLCWKHLRNVLDDVKDRSRRRSILAVEADCLRAIRSDLALLIQRTDHRSQDRIQGEAWAWKRAANKIAGFGPHSL
jgi:hypothetical protein